MTKQQIKSLKAWLTQERDEAARASSWAYGQGLRETGKFNAGEEAAYDNVLRRLVFNDFEARIEKSEGK